MAMEAPVLLVLDCCAAAGVDPGKWATLPTGIRRARTNKELIAASGFHEQAPEPGEYSLTHSLIDVLYDVAARAGRHGELATASDVHSLTKLRMLRLYIPGEDRVRTPMYEIMNNGGTSIMLAPTPARRAEQMGYGGGPALAHPHPHQHALQAQHHHHQHGGSGFRSSYSRVARRRLDRKREKMAEFEAQRALEERLRQQQRLEQTLLKQLTADSDESYFSSSAFDSSGDSSEADSGYSSDAFSSVFSQRSDGDVRYSAGMTRRQHARNEPPPGCFAYASVPRTFGRQGPLVGVSREMPVWAQRFGPPRMRGSSGVVYAQYPTLAIRTR